MSAPTTAAGRNGATTPLSRSSSVGASAGPTASRIRSAVLGPLPVLRTSLPELRGEVGRHVSLDADPGLAILRVPQRPALAHALHECALVVRQRHVNFRPM